MLEKRILPDKSILAKAKPMVSKSKTMLRGTPPPCVLLCKLTEGIDANNFWETHKEYLNSQNVEWSPFFDTPVSQLNNMKRIAEERTNREKADLSLIYKVSVPQNIAGDIFDWLLDLDDIEYVECEPEIVEATIPTPTPPNYTIDQLAYQGNELESLQGMNIRNLWNITKGQGVKILVTDNGNPYDSHINLVDKQLNVVEFNKNDQHSTATTGIVAATDNRDDEWGVVGVAPGADVYNSGYLARIVSNVSTAGLEEGDVITMSLTTGVFQLFELWDEGKTYTYGHYVEYDSNTYRCKVETSLGDKPASDSAAWVITGNSNFTYSLPIVSDLTYYNKLDILSSMGVIIFMASGNDDLDLNQDVFRENLAHKPFHEGALPVFIVSGGNENRSKSSFANWSSHSDSVDNPCCLQALSVNIPALGYGTLWKNENDPTNEDYWYDNFSGTSGSTPIVASGAALLQSVSKNLTGNVLSPQEMKQILYDSGREPTNEPNPYFKARTPDLMKALEMIDVGEYETYIQYRKQGESTWQETEPIVANNLGNFSYDKFYLEFETEYEFRAACLYNGEYFYSNIETLTTGEPVEIGEYNTYIQYRETGEDVWQETTAKTAGTIGFFDETISGLNPNKKYEFRAVGYDGEEYFYSDSKFLAIGGESRASSFVKVDGEIKEVASILCKVDGEWQNIEDVYIKENGVWRML